MAAWIVGACVTAFLCWAVLRGRSAQPSSLIPSVSMLPDRFIVFDLETTGLHADRHEIIEIGAIRIVRDAKEHETFQTLVKPRRGVPSRITELTGISADMIERDGLALAEALREFRDFVGDLPMVAFNAKFDDGFLRAACADSGVDAFPNEMCCALELARRAWPERQSFKLADLARDGNLDLEDNHRALGDCRRTVIVYGAAARTVGSYR